MEIIVTKGIGKGTTGVSAFDAALMNAGIADYNLIYLSSIIPPASRLIIDKYEPREDEYGNRLYVVISRCDQYAFGKEAWAGLGWVTDEGGRGLFVEQKAECEEEVVRLIDHSLSDMRESRPYKFGEIAYSVVGIECEDRPVCAVVAAVYKSESFEQ
jgi:arginine decarboxylase